MELRTYKPPKRWVLSAFFFLLFVGLGLAAVSMSHVLDTDPLPGERFFGKHTERTMAVSYASIAVNLFGTAVCLGYFMFARAFILRQTRMEFSACMGCGYDLRSTADGSVCPECGRKVDIAATRDEVARLARRHPNLFGSIPITK